MIVTVEICKLNDVELVFLFWLGKNIEIPENHCLMLNDVLVSGLEHGFYDFPCIGNVIIPIDFHIFQDG